MGTCASASFMGKEIIINAEKEQTRIAIVENNELAELYIENPENERTLGDIILGRVRKIMPSIQAAFIDIGQKQDAFLHFSDLSDNLPDLLTLIESDEPEVGKMKPQTERLRPRGRRRQVPHARRKESDETSEGGESAEHEHRPQSRAEAEQRGRRRQAQLRSKQKPETEEAREEEYEHDDVPERQSDVPLQNYLKRDQRILVKIVKEPISTKGSRVSTDISLAGRFLVLVPMANYIAVSKKIASYKERRRLRTLAKSLTPEGFGVIVRTVAEGKNAKALDTDLRLLVDKWRRIEKKLQGKPNPPLIVHEDVNMASSVIRDLFSDDYDRILIDDQRLYRNIKSYVQAVAPQMAPAVQWHKDRKHIFEETKIAKEFAQAFESRVELPSGGYLFIEKTEAMYVIDVNSGRSGRGMTQEANSLKVNLEAARILARQVRLRDIGGIIVVDFIDLRDDKNRQKVFDELRKEFRKDRAVVKILPMSDFGLIQITRQRLRPSITVTFAGPNGSAVPLESRGKDRGSRPAIPAPTAEPVLTESEPRPREERAPARQSVRNDRKRPDPEALVERMERWIMDYKTHGKRNPLVLKVHPFTAAYLHRKVPTYPTRWFMRHLIRLRVEIDSKLDPLSFRFLDGRTNEDLTDRIELSKTPQKARQGAEVK